MKGSKHLRILCTNAFGLASKLPDLQHALLQHQPDVAIVTETKFTAEKVLPSDISFPGYSSPLRLDRTAHGGGVAIWVKSSLPSMLIPELMSPAHEIIWVSLQLAPGLRTVLGAVYRPGSCAPGDLTLIDHLDNILPEARHQGSHIILAGDFNVHNRAWLNSSKSTPAGEALEDTCVAHLLVQHVTVPTRGDNPLDLIMSTFTSPVTTRILPPLGRSDHAVVLSDFSSVLPRREPPVKRTVFRYNRADWDRLRAHLRNVEWGDIITEDPETSCEQVTASITAAVEQFVPSKVLETRPSDPVWWTPECTETEREKEKRWRDWRKHPYDPVLQQAFTDSVTVAIATQFRSRRAKEDSLRRSLSTGSLRDKQWWTKLKNAAGNRTQPEIPLVAQV